MSFGLMRDQALRQRSTTGSDSEGNTNLSDTIEAVVWGTWGAPSATDLESAGHRSMRLDAIFAFNIAYDIAIEDRLLVKGVEYSVVDVVDARIHKRALLRYLG